MGLSIIDTQRELILEAIRKAAQGQWKYLVVDDDSRRIIDNVLKTDDILDEKVLKIEMITDRRQSDPETDVVYLLSPLPYIVDCLMADFEARRYRGTYLFWTSILPPNLRERLNRSQMAQSQIQVYRVLNIDFFPRESHLVTMRDPFSFLTLYHPACSNLVKQHISDISQRVVSICVALGEYPTIRYFKPPNPSPSHEAHVLCSFIANAVQQEIDTYAQWNENFPPQSNRPRAALYVLDRSLDLYAPFMHEFTYQAMAHDLLPIKDGDKVTFRTTVNEGRDNEEVKDMEIGEKDRLWVDNRHRHMKDTIDKLMSDFRNFMAQNPHFAQQSNTTNLNTIRDMLAGLPQFQEMKEAYSLHLNMAQGCMGEFEKRQLLELSTLEQTLATGLDDDYKKPKNVADQLVRILDEDSTIPPDRLRLIALYVLFRDGVIAADIDKLLRHSQLPPQDQSILRNLELLGAHVYKDIKDTSRPQQQPQRLFPPKAAPQAATEEELALSRFDTNLRTLLDKHVSGTLDSELFPYVKPELAPAADDPAASISSASLRSAKPTWARTKLSSIEPRQRIIVFMAGGATYSEARACYEVSQNSSRDVVLLTSHMLTPGFFLQQLADLSVDRRQLRLPADAPAKRAPDHLFEQRPAPSPAPSAGMSRRQGGLPPLPGGGAGARPSSSSPPTEQMNSIKLNGGAGPETANRRGAMHLPHNGPEGGSHASGSSSSHKLRKDKYDYEDDKKKKKHHFFSSKKS